MPDFSGTLLTSLWHRFIQFCIQYSSIALLYFDYSLTLADEVEWIWRRPFRWNTILFIFTRYALAANVLYLGMASGWLTPYVPSSPLLEKLSLRWFTMIDDSYGPCSSRS